MRMPSIIASLVVALSGCNEPPPEPTGDWGAPPCMPQEIAADLATCAEIQRVAPE